MAGISDYTHLSTPNADTPRPNGINETIQQLADQRTTALFNCYLRPCRVIDLPRYKQD